MERGHDREGEPTNAEDNDDDRDEESRRERERGRDELRSGSEEVTINAAAAKVANEIARAVRSSTTPRRKSSRACSAVGIVRFTPARIIAPAVSSTAASGASAFG